MHETDEVNDVDEILYVTYRGTAKPPDLISRPQPRVNVGQDEMWRSLLNSSYPVHNPSTDWVTAHRTLLRSTSTTISNVLSGLRWEFKYGLSEDIDMQAAELEGILERHHRRLNEDLDAKIETLATTVDNLGRTVETVSQDFYRESVKQAEQIKNLAERAAEDRAEIRPIGNKLDRLDTTIRVAGVMIGIGIPAGIALIELLLS